MTHARGRYQVAHHVKVRRAYEPIPAGYKEECVRESGKGMKLWVSETPTHYFDNRTKELTPLDENSAFDKWDMSVKIIPERYKTIDEMKGSLKKEI